MTTEEFEIELQKLLKAGHITETQMQASLSMHRDFKAGKTKPKLLEKK